MLWRSYKKRVYQSHVISDVGEFLEVPQNYQYVVH